MQQERESGELCLNGCGFFGAPGSGGMCSVCWKKTMSDRQVETTLTSRRSMEMKMNELVSEKQDNVITGNRMCGEISTKEQKRCWECKKKVGLTAMECRCGYVFCNSHRFEDQHPCSFDFKTADRAELARRNPGGGTFSKLEKL
ncbi:unnamed protein product [Peronospora belbahrii]|uniref:Uncharacterized protein n=1 Tax=Peronospora belbahrii TaxID=622444 RepID=A0ABN8CT02_9STRA|nr:unnamed protein product [Peronospora belbahrii]